MLLKQELDLIILLSNYSSFFRLTKAQLMLQSFNKHNSTGAISANLRHKVWFEGRTKVRDLHGVSDSGTAGALAIRNTFKTKLLE